MAARIWRWVLALGLALAAAAGMLVAGALSLPRWSVAPLALAMLACAPAAFVALTFAIAHSAPRALPGEVAAFLRAILAMSVPGGPAPAPPATVPRPVLLLHGLLCNHRVWSRLAARLHESGFGPVEALDIEPLLADIDVQAGRIAPLVLALQGRCHGARVLIVAHSMGGLVARALLRDLGAGVVRAIVTIASPHHGTALARGWPWPATRQMRRSSPWLAALNDAQEGHLPVRVVSIYSADDNIVAPAGSARLAAAEQHELRGLGHFALLRSGQVLDLVVAALSAERPA